MREEDKKLWDMLKNEKESLEYVIDNLRTKLNIKIKELIDIGKLMLIIKERKK